LPFSERSQSRERSCAVLELDNRIVRLFAAGKTGSYNQFFTVAARI
jgi:hypothetical protein